MQDKEEIVVVVGTGINQLGFIKKLKKRGVKICGFGKGRNNDEAVRMCDYFKVIDTGDAEAAIEWIDSLDKNVVGAGSFAGGVAINTLQEIERKFDLSTSIPKALSVGMNKLDQQILYEKLNIGALQTFQLSKSNLEKVDSRKDYIIKPGIGRGSSGVRKVAGKELDLILKSGMDQSDEVVQEFFKGDEYRVFVFIEGGEIKVLSSIERQSKKGSYLLGRLLYKAEVKAGLTSIFRSIAKKLELKNCVLKADVLLGSSEYRLIEMDIGVGGGQYFKEFVSSIEGIDITEKYIDLILGKRVNIPKASGNSLVMDYLYLESGVYKIDEALIADFISDIVDPLRIQFNSLIPQKFHAKTELNSDFVATVIHGDSIKNSAFNERFNDFMNRFKYDYQTS